MPLHESMKSIWGVAFKPVTPEAFAWMRNIVTGQLFGTKGIEMRA